MSNTGMAALGSALHRLCFTVLSLSLGAAPVASQVTMPPVNLGVTSLTDGMSGPGWLLEPLVFEYYWAGRFTDTDGKTIPGKNSFSAVSNLFHLAYATKHRILGGFYGIEVLLPLARLDLDTEFGPVGSSSGLGDLIVSPLILHWPGRTLFGKPYFSRFSTLAVLPTGKYDATRPVNVGNHVTSVTAYYAFTWMLRPKWETSWRLFYLWNSRNNQPFAPLGVSNSQPGQAFHLNYAISRELSHRFRAGINGYAFTQLTRHRLGGTALPGSKERVFAAGPALQWSGRGWNVFGNVNYEFGAKKRPEGSKVVLRFQRIVGAP